MIGILYICTGKYDIFWEQFFLSAEKYLFPGNEKKYFVFTDSAQLYAEKNHKVQKVYQESLGWPYDTLLRFKMFLGIEDDLRKCDYVFFFNANIIFVDIIGCDIFPSDDNDGLLAVKHPGFWNKPCTENTYDRNTASTAYIPYGEGKDYFMGGFNGGKTSAYLQLINTLNQNIHADLEKGIIALWHDESHLNKYLIAKNPKVLSPAYGYAEGLDIPFKPKLIILSKEKYGGHDYLRNISDKKTKRSKLYFEKIKIVAKVFRVLRLLK